MDGQPSELERILIVDDQDLVRFVMERTLETLGFDCELLAVGSGREALEAMEDRAFDLIITDLRMPDVGGVELTEQVRAGGSDAVVLWITAYGCASFSAEAEQLDVFRCVEKPLEVGMVREVVRRALGRKRPRSGA
jgi:DNA-binding NtrC family response regulator